MSHDSSYSLGYVSHTPWPPVAILQTSCGLLAMDRVVAGNNTTRTESLGYINACILVTDSFVNRWVFGHCTRFGRCGQIGQQNHNVFLLSLQQQIQKVSNKSCVVIVTNQTKKTRCKNMGRPANPSDMFQTGGGLGGWWVVRLPFFCGITTWPTWPVVPRLEPLRGRCLNITQGWWTYESLVDGVMVWWELFNSQPSR